MQLKTLGQARLYIQIYEPPTGSGLTSSLTEDSIMSTAQPTGGFGTYAPSPQPEWLKHLQRWKPAQRGSSFVPTRPDSLWVLLARLRAGARAQEDLRHAEFIAGG